MCCTYKCTHLYVHTYVQQDLAHIGCTIVLQVMARQHAAAGAQQLQHQTVANGDKYALPEKVAAKNKPVSI